MGNGGHTAINNSVMDNYWLLEKSSLESREEIAVYQSIYVYNKEEKQWQSMEAAQLISWVSSLLQPGKITPSGITQCFAQGGGQRL